ncbi:Aldo/keto reductase [Exidia glandulosa HHB12029]|uniref:Aldo/keto reductase n=1 Tax=Exidia glandulosa HHB12029 TaxID=1314781 RepID=A0A165DTV2_EXIGL|nr:Aldo/keto reductase [Exidia glandulosa HHB12029]
MEYQRLGTSGLKVSKIILGCMSYGSSKWQDWVLDEEKALPLLKAAYDAGINTWDTADMYSNGVSETIIGKAITKYNIPRKKLVVMTKCFCGVNEEDPSSLNHRSTTGEWVNQTGLSRKHIFDAVDASVARLGTYIDVLQIHRFDPETPPEEIMEALHDVVKSGKVRYIGASTMWAHEFATLQFTATLHGWTKFISMQNYYNLAYREEEREVIPFCNKTGVGLIPWSPVARGLLARPYAQETVRSNTDGYYKILYGAGKAAKTREAAIDEEVVGRIEKVAKDKGVPMAGVAIAWVVSKGCAPIVGLSSEKRIQEAIDALKIKLTPEEVKFLEDAYEPKKVQGNY